jgi:hypothetical protein
VKERERGRREGHTVKLPKDSVHGAGAATAGHADVELVGVVCHLCFFLYLSDWSSCGVGLVGYRSRRN